MSGTPSKDRAEAHLPVAMEAVSQALGGSRSLEGFSRPIAAALATAHDNGFAEGMKRAAEYREQLAEVTDRFEQMAGATYATASDRRAIKKARELLNRGAE